MSTDDWTPRGRDELLAHIYEEGRRRRHRRQSMLTAGIVALVLLLAVPVFALVNDNGADTRVGTADDETTTITVDEAAPQGGVGQATTTTLAGAGPAKSHLSRPAAAPKPFLGEMITFGPSPHISVGEIHRINPDGTGQWTLLKGAAEVMETAWSPDGRRVAYVVKTSENGRRLYIADREGKSEALTDELALLEGLTWRPDGKALGYMRGPFGDKRAKQFVLETRTETEVIAGKVDSGPSWSPDGKSLAIALPEKNDQGDDSYFVFVVNLETGERRRASNRTYGFEKMPRWSPDGTHLAMGAAHKTIAAFAYQLVIHRVGELEPVNNSAGGGFGIGTLAWSPDGRRVVFSVGSGRSYCCYWGNQQVSVMDRDTPGYRVLVQNAQAVGWAPAVR